MKTEGQFVILLRKYLYACLRLSGGGERRLWSRVSAKFPAPKPLAIFSISNYSRWMQPSFVLTWKLPSPIRRLFFRLAFNFTPRNVAHYSYVVSTFTLGSSLRGGNDFAALSVVRGKFFVSYFVLRLGEFAFYFLRFWRWRNIAQLFWLKCVIMCLLESFF